MEHIIFSTILCATCTDELILAYKFLKKVENSDERYLNDLQLDFEQTDDDDTVTDKTLVLDADANVAIISNAAFNTTTDSDTENQVTDEYFNTLFENTIEDEHLSEHQNELNESADPEPQTYKIVEATKLRSSVEDTDNNERTKHYNLNDKKMMKFESKKSNIVITSNVASILKNVIGIDTTKAMSVATKTKNTPCNNKRSSDMDTDEIRKYKYSKKIKQNELDTNCIPHYIAVPQFNISNQIVKSSGLDEENSNNLVDGLVTLSTPCPTTTIKTLDVTAVRVNRNSVISFDPKDINSDSEMESERSMYMCKYCPKAFSTSHHLILHTRKSHVCQYCLEGFGKITELQRHVKQHHRKFDCAICMKEFGSNSNLRAHMKRKHSIICPPNVCLMSMEQLTPIDESTN